MHLRPLAISHWRALPLGCALLSTLTGCASRAETPTTSATAAQRSAPSPSPSPSSSQEATAPVRDPFAGLDHLTGDALHDAAMAGSPALRSGHAEVAAAQARVPQTRAFPDPTVSYQVSPWTLGRGREPGHQATLSQPLPWPGKRGARTDAAAAGADAAGEELGEMERHHLLESRMLFAEYWLAYRRIALNSATRVAIERTQSAALSAIAAGAASGDALDATLALSELDRALLTAERERAVKAAEINALVGRAADASLPPPSEQLAKVLALPERGLLMRLAARRPEVRAAEARMREAEARLRLSHRDQYPDVQVTVGYTSMETRHDEDVFVGAAVTLPLDRGRRRGAIDEATALVDRARAERDRAVAEAGREALDAFARLDEGAHALALLRERTLPAAAQAVAAAQSAYAAGTGSVTALLRAQRTELAVRLMEADELHEYYHQLGNLECCIGVPVQSIAVASAGEDQP